MLDKGCGVHLGANQQTCFHGHPAWKLVASRRGRLRCRTGTEEMCARAVLVPPHLEHALCAEGAFAAVFIDPLRFNISPRATAVVKPLALGKQSKVQLREVTEISWAAAGGGVGEGEVHAAVEGLVASLNLPKRERQKTSVVDTQWLLHHGNEVAPSLGGLASRVGLSGSRLRHLFVEEVGVPLRKYRLWARLLRTLSAAAQIPQLNNDSSSGSRALTALCRLAQEQGFSDQAHMTRTFSRVLGRTPGSLRGRFVSLYREY